MQTLLRSYKAAKKNPNLICNPLSTEPFFEQMEEIYGNNLDSKKPNYNESLEVRYIIITYSYDVNEIYSLFSNRNQKVLLIICPCQIYSHEIQPSQHIIKNPRSTCLFLNIEGDV